MSYINGEDTLALGWTLKFAKGSIFGASQPFSALQSMVSIWSVKNDQNKKGKHKFTKHRATFVDFEGEKRPVKILPKANWSTGGFGFISVSPAWV